MNLTTLKDMKTIWLDTRPGRARLSSTVLAALVVFGGVATASAQAPKPTTTFTGDVGYVTASGNTRLSTLSVDDKLAHAEGQWVFTQLAAYVYGETDAKQTANQFRFSGRADYAFLPRLGVFAGASYERNPFAGFNSRTDEILGLQWKAIVAPWDSLSVDGGGDLAQEADVDHTNHSFPSARVAANYKHVFSKTAYLQQLVEYVPNVQTSGSYRANSESDLVAPISAHIGIKVSYSVRYDSKPPVNFGTTDRVLTTGVQVTF